MKAGQVMEKIRKYYQNQVLLLKSKEDTYGDPDLAYNKPFYMTKRVLDKYEARNDKDNK